MKKTQNVSLPALVLLAVLGFGILGLLLISPFVATDKGRVKKMTNVQIEYSKLHDKAEFWWLSKTPPPVSFAQAADVAWKRGEDIRAMMAKHSEVSEYTRAIWDTFQDFGATIQINTRLPLKTISNPTERDLEGLKKGHEIIFVSEELILTHIRFGSTGVLLGWRSDAGVSLAAIEWPEKFLVGALYHEFHHSSIHPVDVNNPQLRSVPMDTEWYANEEVNAHRIESSVLNAVTNGDYHRKIDEILRRTYPWSNAKDAAAAVTINDLKEFDKMFQLESAGGVVSSFSYSQFILAVAIRFMDREGETDQGKLFLWLREEGIMGS